MTFREKYIGDRAFYRRVFAVMVPVLIQQVITNFVSLLDNLMVGQIGTEPMSGVAIVNQLLFVFNLCIFGGMAGPGIFTAQFYGREDPDGVRHTFRAKWYVGVVSTAVGLLVLVLGGTKLISLFLHEGDAGLDLMETLRQGQAYLRVMLWQMLPFAAVQVYASTLRETGETMVPMRAGLIAVGVNLVFNYILIFGKLGAPVMGVRGAAIATVLARVVEFLIVAIWTHRHTDKCSFIRGAYRSARVPLDLAKKMTVMGLPLLVNEVLWSSGMTTLNQCYSLRGLEVVSAMNISSTVSNLFFCAFFAMGTTVSIVVGQHLGAGRLQQAVDEDRKLIAFAVALCCGVGAVMALISPLIPRLYNTTDVVRHLAEELLIVTSVMMPFFAFTNGCYFTLRSGGKTMITFLFDSAFVWGVCIPLAFFLSRCTSLAILPMYILVQSLELIKCITGFLLVKSRRWVNNLVSEI